MFLIIYKRGSKRYFNLSKKLTDSFTVTNEKMETVKLGYKQKMRSYRFDGWEDFKKIRDELRSLYGLRMFVAEVKLPDKTHIKLVIELMNNPLYSLVLKETEEKNEVPEGDTGIRLVELFEPSDWNYAKDEFKFESDFINNLW